MNKIVASIIIALHMLCNMANAQCTACFTATPDVSNPNVFNIDASCSSPNTIISYEFLADGVSNFVWPLANYSIGFSTPGAHTISVITTTSLGCIDTATQSFTIVPNCSAQFGNYSIANNTNAFYIINNVSSTATYAWNFGDNNTSTIPNPTHIYATPGTYNACLTIDDTAYGGCTNTFCDSVVVYNLNAPQCFATINVLYPSVGNTYTCDASASIYDSINNIFQWTVNGLVMQASISPIYTLTLSNGLPYDLVGLMILDSNGNLCNATSTYIVNPFFGNNTNTCQAYFAITPTSLYYDTVAINATASLLGVNGSKQWYIDGIASLDTSSVQTLIFNTVGYHNIVLQIKDSTGNICDSLAQTIYTQNPPCISCIAVTQVAGSTSDYVLDASCSNPGTTNLAYYWSIAGITAMPYAGILNTPVLNYTFLQSDVYNACLNVYDYSNNTFCSQICTTLVVNTPTIINTPIIPCHAYFYYTSLSSTSDSVLVNATSASIPAGGRLQWLVDNNLIQDTASIQTFSFSTIGYHYITLYTVDSFGNYCDSFAQYTYTFAQPCTSCFNVTQVSGSSSDYLLDATCANASANAATYYWTITSPNTNTYASTTATPNLAYTFTQSDTFNVCLYVYDNATNTFCSQSCTTLVVNTSTIINPNNTCHASFFYNSASSINDSVIVNGTASLFSIGGSLQWKVDGILIADTSSVQMFDLSAIGYHFITLYTVDSNGNYCDSFAQYTYTFAQVCASCVTATQVSGSSSDYVFDASCTNASVASAMYYWSISSANTLTYSLNSISPSFTYTFTQSDTYNICLNVLNVATNTFCTQACTSVVVTVPIVNVPVPCTASFYIVSQSSTSDTVLVNATASSISNGGSLQWKVDSNFIADTANVQTIVFNTPGYHQIHLYTVDSLGNYCDSFSQLIYVMPPLCNSCINIIQVPNSNIDYIFDASCSNIVANANYNWTINNNYVANSIAPIFTNTFTQSGIYNVCLTIFNTATNTFCTQACSTLVVNVPIVISNSCIAVFGINPLSANYDTITIDATAAVLSAGGSIQWQIDGVLSSDTSIFQTITFSNPGYHYITLFTKDSLGIICDSLPQYIYTYAPQCTSCLSVSPTPNSISDYLFDGNCTNATSNTNYSWSVNNSFVASTVSPTFNYSFTQSGTYSVCLSVYDNIAGTYCTQSCTSVVVTTPIISQFDICGTIYSADSLQSFNYVPVGASDATVYLVTLQSGGLLEAIDSTTTDSFGHYCFNNLPIFDYRIKAALNPSSAHYTYNIPTYYQFADMWFNANVITLANANSYNRDVFMMYGVNTGGPGIISGNVFQGANKKSRSDDDLGLDGLTLMLVDASTNKVVAHKKAAINGTYEFKNLPMGNYKLYGESINKQSVPALVNLTASSFTKSEVNMEVNKAVINPTNVVLSVKTSIAVNQSYKIYPNPTSANFTIENKSSFANATITDFAGKLLMQLDVKANSKTYVDTKNWAKGIYFIQINNGGANYVEKLVVE